MTKTRSVRHIEFRKMSVYPDFMKIFA